MMMMMITKATYVVFLVVITVPAVVVASVDVLVCVAFGTTWIRAHGSGHDH